MNKTINHPPVFTITRWYVYHFPVMGGKNVTINEMNHRLLPAFRRAGVDHGIVRHHLAIGWFGIKSTGQPEMSWDNLWNLWTESWLFRWRCSLLPIQCYIRTSSSDFAGFRCFHLGHRTVITLLPSSETPNSPTLVMSYPVVLPQFAMEYRHGS